MLLSGTSYFAATQRIDTSLYGGYRHTLSENFENGVYLRVPGLGLGSLISFFCIRLSAFLVLVRLDHVSIDIVPN